MSPKKAATVQKRESKTRIKAAPNKAKKAMQRTPAWLSEAVQLKAMKAKKRLKLRVNSDEGRQVILENDLPPPVDKKAMKAMKAMKAKDPGDNYGIYFDDKQELRDCLMMAMNARGPEQGCDHVVKIANTMWKDRQDPLVLRWTRASKKSR